MKWRSEAQMQTDFTAWQVSPSGVAWVISRSSVGACAAAFELKHVCCDGRDGIRSACIPGQCASRLAIGEHEEMQADALRYACGLGLKRAAKAHKISDMSAGYKPFDCFTFGHGSVCRFVMGWSCGHAPAARVYAVGFEAVEAWRCNGVASITEAMAAEVGERLDAFDGGK